MKRTNQLFRRNKKWYVREWYVERVGGIDFQRMREFPARPGTCIDKRESMLWRPGDDTPSSISGIGSPQHMKPLVFEDGSV